MTLTTLQERHVELAKQGQVDLRDAANLRDPRHSAKKAEQVTTAWGVFSIE